MAGAQNNGNGRTACILPWSQAAADADSSWSGVGHDGLRNNKGHVLNRPFSFSFSILPSIISFVKEATVLAQTRTKTDTAPSPFRLFRFCPFLHPSDRPINSKLTLKRRRRRRRRKKKKIKVHPKLNSCVRFEANVKPSILCGTTRPHPYRISAISPRHSSVTLFFLKYIPQGIRKRSDQHVAQTATVGHISNIQ